MSKPCCAIDVHTHVVPAQLPDHVAAFGDIPWPLIQHTDSCHAKVIIQGKNYRDIENACWDVPRRSQEMAGMDVGSQVLSPMPELLSYWLPAKPAQILARHITQTIPDMVRTPPPRFHALAIIPLQDINLPLRDLDPFLPTLSCP